MLKIKTLKLIYALTVGERLCDGHRLSGSSLVPGGRICVIHEIFSFRVRIPEINFTHFSHSPIILRISECRL